METPAPEPAKVDPVPPPTGIAALWKHITNWAEVYFWVPLALLSIWLFAQGAYFLTGRRPQENADWIVGLGGNLVKCVFLIVILSIVRQQTGVWWRREELMANKHLAYTQAFSSCVALIVFAYLLSH
jgi:hypothetical protein